MSLPKHTHTFWTVTGRDFGRSIAWSRRWINPLSAAELRRRLKTDPVKVGSEQVQNSQDNSEPAQGLTGGPSS
jgi:hypothetical protein